jgi:hypothetical protein
MRDPGFRGHDIGGQRFGNLIALRPFESTQRGIVWTCQCTCGRIALRTVAHLRQSERKGCISACRRCIQARRSESFADRRAGRRIRFLRYWNAWGTLYPFETYENLDLFVDEVEEPLRLTVVAGLCETGHCDDLADGESFTAIG